MFASAKVVGFVMRWRLAITCILLASLVSACGGSDPINNFSFKQVKASMGMDAGEDASIPRMGHDATITIILASNKERTRFVVNGEPLPSSSKQVKVMVPRGRLMITAQAPCYRPLEQGAGENDFGPSSLFEFTFANWDRMPGQAGARCT